MASRLVLVSDTHVPQRAHGLPDGFWRAVDEADVVLHAGDWTDLPIADELAIRARRLIGVQGNNDSAGIRERFPIVARETIDGIRFAVVHETGDAATREARSGRDYPDTDVLVFGHSHIPWDSVTPGGLRLLNPGSPTDRRRQPSFTIMTAVADAGVLRDVSLVDV